MTAAERAAWEDARVSRLGASEAAAVLGIHPWRSPLDVWADKMGITPKQARNQVAANAGHHMENFIADLWLEERGDEHGVATLVAAGLNSVTHPDHACISATPDLYARNTDGEIVGLVECKLVGWRLRNHWRDEDRQPVTPDYVRVQAIIQMACTGQPWAAVAALHNDGWETQHDLIRRDETLETKVVDLLAAWWDKHIISGERPDLTGTHHDQTRRILDATHTPNPGLVDITDPAAAELAAEIGRLKQIAKAVDDDIADTENRLRAILGDTGTEFRTPGALKPFATWKQQTRTGLDTKRLRAERPDIADEYATESTYKVLRVYPARTRR